MRLVSRKAKPPNGRTWFPLYVSKWNSKTTHLTCEQDGAYGRLVRFYWQNGAPPDNDETLARIIGEPIAKWRKLRPVLAPFFVIANGLWRHETVEEELAVTKQKIQEWSERGAAAAKARWEAQAARQTDASCMLHALHNACIEDAPIPIPSPTFGGESEDLPADKVVRLVPPHQRSERG